MELSNGLHRGAFLSEIWIGGVLEQPWYKFVFKVDRLDQGGR